MAWPEITHLPKAGSAPVIPAILPLTWEPQLCLPTQVLLCGAESFYCYTLLNGLRFRNNARYRVSNWAQGLDSCRGRGSLGWVPWPHCVVPGRSLLPDSCFYPFILHMARLLFSIVVTLTLISIPSPTLDTDRISPCPFPVPTVP